MELTATNRSQAYPKAENGYGYPGTDRHKALRSKGTDENAKHFWKYPCEVEVFEAKVRV